MPIYLYEIIATDASEPPLRPAVVIAAASAAAARIEITLHEEHCSGNNLRSPGRSAARRAPEANTHPMNQMSQPFGDEAAATAILQTRQLCVEFRTHGNGQETKVALRGLDLAVRPGEVFGFLGPNGAGKTTTMNVLLGCVNATSGSAELFGVDINPEPVRERLADLRAGQTLTPPE